MRPRVVSRHRRQWLYRGLALALGLVGTLVGLELVLRLRGEAPTAIFARGRYLPNLHTTVRDPESRRLITVRTNALGFRGGRPSGDPSRLRVAFVGDSFVAGWSVPEAETFVQKTAQQLSHWLGTATEGMNFGVSGCDLADYLQIYRHFVRPVAPPLVVGCVFHGNDLRGRFPELATDNTWFDFETYATAEPAGVRHFLMRHSAAYAWIADRQRRARDRARELFAAAFPPLYARMMHERFQRRWIDYRIYAEPSDDEGERCWHVMEHHLRAWAREAQAAGSVLVIVGIPAAEQVNDGMWRALCRDGGRRDGDGWSREAPDRRLGAMAGRIGVPYLSLLPRFRTHPHTESLYFGRGHFTPAGHSLAAQAIAEFLRDWLSRDPRSIANQSRFARFVERATP